jgi:NDP-sugar pyrophosphorylase family protein
MMNVVIPLAANLFFDSTEYYYPKPLIEVRGTPIIQLVVDSLMSLPDPKRFIFILSRKDDAKFHLQDTLRLVTGNRCEIVILEGQSKGAVCSVLMAIKHIQGKDPVVVANADQVFKMNLSDVTDQFKKADLAAGVICMDSVHPRWSYVRVNDDNLVVEAAVHRPLTRHAVAGFYYFATGDDLVRLSMKHIEKGAEVNDQFYVATVMNEFVLEDKRVGIFQIDNSLCRTYYSIQKIEEAQREG